MKREYLSGKFVWTPVSPQSRTCIARVTLSILCNSKAEGIRMALGGGGR